MRKCTCSHNAVQLLVLPSVGDHLHSIRVKSFFKISSSSPHFLLYFFLFALCPLQVLHWKEAANEYARLACASSPCLCPCSSSRTWDSGNGCCSSGWHLQHQTEISRWENLNFLLTQIHRRGCVTDKERRRWCFQTDTHGKSDERVKRGGGGGAESRICVTPNDIAHFKPPCFCSIYHLWRRAAGEAIKWEATKNL